MGEGIDVAASTLPCGDGDGAVVDVFGVGSGVLKKQPLAVVHGITGMVVVLVVDDWVVVVGTVVVDVVEVVVVQSSSHSDVVDVVEDLVVVDEVVVGTVVVDVVDWVVVVVLQAVTTMFDCW